ncbi:MAG: hypothetical protein NTU53_10095 [Planctomycetota bacterium]|nr:hypothetical protein [Planctomycetota bacterium]
MRLSTMFGVAVLGSLFVAVNVMAQAAAQGGGQGRGPGAGMQQDPFQQTIAALGDLNLRPDFNLSKEQKEKLQAVRDDVKKAEDKWRADHADDLKKIQEETQAARGDQDKMGEVMTKRRELMQTQPKSDDAAKQVKALLTEDQAKALEKRITERQAEMRARMGGMGGMGGRGGRGAQGGGGAGQ